MLNMYRLLEGMTIVEGAAFIAGPSCGLNFAQMGAKVIRFDQIGGGPDFRRWPLGPAGQSLYWEGLNKGKRSISIDLTRADGRELARRIACSGDGLFVTNFPAEGFLSYARLAEFRSDLVCLRIMGWPSGKPAVDYTVNAAVGLPMMTGHPDDPRPINHVLPAWDLLAGAYGSFALLAAERDRRASGSGREIRLALSDLAAATLGHLGQVAEVTLGRRDRPRSGNDLFGAFGSDFTTLDGAQIMLVAITGRQWTSLVEALGLGVEISLLETELGVVFEVDEGARFLNRDRLFPIFVSAVARRRLGELATTLDAAGVTWSSYATLYEALSDTRLFGDDTVFSDVAHASGANYSTPGAPVRISDEGRTTPAPAPRLGQHTDEILAELLGYSSERIARLHDEGIVA